MKPTERKQSASGPTQPRSRKLGPVPLVRRDTRRRFEQWAKNPSCEANTISAVCGVPMAEVARREGVRSTMGQSPFALAGGVTFERSLFKQPSKGIVPALVSAAVLPPGAEGFLDLRLRQNGGPCKNLDEALGKTRVLLARLAEAPSGAPTLVAGAAVRIPGDPILPEALLVIDILAIRIDEAPVRLIVGEVKTYPDRGGYTDRTDLAGARAQAGVYVHGLRTTIEELALQDRVSVANRGFLVLRRPGSFRPSVRANEDLRFQADRACRGVARLREVAKELKEIPEADAMDAVIQAPVAYQPTCVAFCDRAAGCYMRQMQEGDPAVLGEDVARFLGPINLHHAVKLMKGARAANDAERDFVRRVKEVEAPQ